MNSREPVATKATQVAPPPTSAVTNALATGRVSARLRWPLLVVITAHAVAVFGQALLAGRFMSGDFEMLDAHFMNAAVIGGLGLTQLVLGFLYWRPGGGRIWPALAFLGVSIAEPLQIEAGLSRNLGLHIPLGVLVSATSLLLTVWAWGPTFGTRRAAKPANAAAEADRSAEAAVSMPDRGAR
jgi:hypothetical protein